MICVISERAPNQPKLKKPKQLKGIKPCLSYKWGGITACQVFIDGSDIWINHHDWCSRVFYQAKVKYKHSFIFNDGFEAPVLKGDAWIVLKSVLNFSKITDVLRVITYECLIDDNSRFCHDDERMFIDVVTELWRTKYE